MSKFTNNGQDNIGKLNSRNGRDSSNYGRTKLHQESDASKFVGRVCIAIVILTVLFFAGQLMR
jgi:hypothetical protein